MHPDGTDHHRPHDQRQHHLPEPAGEQTRVNLQDAQTGQIARLRAVLQADRDNKARSPYTRSGGFTPAAVATAELAISLHEQLHDRSAWPVLPGETCTDQHGTAFTVLIRKLAPETLMEDELMPCAEYDAVPLADIHIDTPVVIYRTHDQNERYFCLPAQIFDEPGRFRKVVPAQPDRP